MEDGGVAFNFDKGSPFPSTFFGNFQRKIVKNSVLQNEIHYYSNYHCQLPIVCTFQKYLQESIWKIEQSVFHKLWFGESISIKILGNVQCKIVKQWNNSILQSIIHNTTVTANLFGIS